MGYVSYVDVCNIRIAIAYAPAIKKLINIVPIY